ncbi:hypothetical protein MSG28_006010 [Choristoneura fumiferana]|uniref:Uncharacterized protein n=1 Tax=Choristoneura fumiferana TaxID=7141 RepID=A0ACC0L175_CHOFU|nr:hypothetical protein MSG28_006010 [Choristoneura fumiferana]
MDGKEAEIRSLERILEEFYCPLPYVLIMIVVFCAFKCYYLNGCSDDDYYKADDNAAKTFRQQDSAV